MTAESVAALLGMVSAAACCLGLSSLHGPAALQLRNLVWATSKHDVYTMHDNCVKHWSGITRQQTEVGLRAPGSRLARPFARAVGICGLYMVQDMHACQTGVTLHPLGSMCARSAECVPTRQQDLPAYVIGSSGLRPGSRDMHACQTAVPSAPLGCKRRMLASHLGYI